MNTTEKMNRLFATPSLISQQLRRSHTMPVSRVEAALVGEDEEARRLIDTYLDSELKREDYGIFLRTLRQASGTEQGALADLLKKTRVAIHNYESGRTEPSFDILNTAVMKILPKDRWRQVSDLLLTKNFEVYLDVLKVIYN